MRKLPVAVAIAGTIVLSMAFTASAVAQNERNASGDQGGKKPMTIDGVVAEITMEGELVVDYRQNKAVEAEAAFLTVIGSPKDSKGGGERQGQAAARGADKEARAGGQREDIYIVWLTPQTKICKAKGEKHEAAGGARSADKEECSLDKLEVGDRVNVQFIPREESDKTHVAHQNEKMRQTHGRGRTHVGYAAEVTIEPPEEHGSSGAGQKGESNR